MRIDSPDFAAEDLAWFLHKYLAARKEWETQMQEFSERRKARGRNASESGFVQVVRAILEEFDAVKQ